MQIFITGPRGCGKSTVAKVIGNRLGPFYAIIEEWDGHAVLPKDCIVTTTKKLCGVKV